MRIRRFISIMTLVILCSLVTNQGLVSAKPNTEPFFPEEMTQISDTKTPLYNGDNVICAYYCETIQGGYVIYDSENHTIIEFGLENKYNIYKNK